MMKMFQVVIKRMLGVFIFSFIAGHAFVAEGSETAASIIEAFEGGNSSGTIGSYFEYTSSDMADNDSGWSNAYFTLKYETLNWKNLTFGARFWAHEELYSDHDNGTTDPFAVDIETKFTLPEFYLTYGFGEGSSATIGRWKNVGHIDDAQSEGGYVSFKEIENLEFLAGAMTRFAEIDYDDGEDFGRTNDAQDVSSNDNYGAGSGDCVLFFETIYQPIDLLELNPYFMYQDEYASVIGLDTNVNAEWEEYEVKYGGVIKYVNVNADIAGSDDANIIAIQPFVQKGSLKIDFSYSLFDDGNALNHPGWLADPFCLADQDAANSNAGAKIFEGRITYSMDKFWVSYLYATADYDTSATEGEGYHDHEFQIGYDFTDNLDINLRYFIVSFDDIDNRDYNKVETRMRFKF